MCVQKVGIFDILLPLAQSFEEGLSHLSGIQEVGRRPLLMDDDIETFYRPRRARYELAIFGEDMSGEEMIDFLRAHGRPPATALETLAFLREHRRVCALWPLACLGTRFSSASPVPRHMILNSVPHSIEQMMCVTGAKLGYRSSKAWSAKAGWTSLTVCT